MRARLVLLAILLAGCAARVPEDEPSPSPREAREREVELEACDVVEAIVAAPPERVRPHVPEVFDLPAGAARVILGGFTCGMGARAFLAIDVTPREASLRGDGVTRYFFEPEHDLDASPLADALRAMRADATRVARIATEVGPAGGTLVVEGDGWAHGISASPGAVPGGAAAVNEGLFREYAAAEGGFVYLQARYVAGEAGTAGIVPGTLRTGEGTPARQVLGPSAEGAVFVLGAYRLADARIGFVPYP